MRLVETEGLWWVVKEPEATYPLKVGAPGRGHGDLVFGAVTALPEVGCGSEMVSLCEGLSQGRAGRGREGAPGGLRGGRGRIPGHLLVPGHLCPQACGGSCSGLTRLGSS